MLLDIRGVIVLLVFLDHTFLSFLFLISNQISNQIANMTNNASASVDGDPFLNIETHSHIKPLTRDALRKMHKAAVGPNSLVNSSGAEEHNEHSRVNKSISNSLAVPGTQPGGSGGEFPPRLSISQRSLSIALALEAQHRAQNESKTCGCFPPLCATEGADHALEEDRPNADLDEGRNLPSIYEPLSAEMEGIPLEEIDANRKRQKVSSSILCIVII